MKTWGIRFGLWLARRCGWTLPPPPVGCARPHGPDLPSDVLASARGLTERAERLDASGEYKRHVVYAALQKDYPTTAKRVLALAIEWVMNADAGTA